MKVERKDPNPQFNPVVITLESQKEVDRLFALFNYNPITDMHPIYSKLFDLLVGFSGENANKYWELVNDTLNK